MSWTITLKADKDIRQEDIDKAVETLSDELKNTEFGPGVKYRWGWSCIVDIFNPEEKTLDIHGSKPAAFKAKAVSKHLAKFLKKCGYKIKIGDLI